MRNKRAIVLISGSGSNMEAIYKKVKEVDIVGVYADRDCAGVERAKKLGLISEYIKNDFFGQIKKIVKKTEVDFIILAGFLKIIPSDFIKNSVPILNIHPSLLPKYGGKGCHGINVHNLVLNSNDEYSGATVHLVDDGIDTGKIIMQSFTTIKGLKTAEEIASAVLKTEHNLYSLAIKSFLRNGGEI